MFTYIQCALFGLPDAIDKKYSIQTILGSFFIKL